MSTPPGSSFDQEGRRLRDHLRLVGENVAAALGDGWRFTRGDGVDGVSCLVDVAGRRVALGWHYGQARKMVVTGHYPRHRLLGYGPRNAPRVNVSADRDPVAIARDLRRRFLPGFCSTWDQWLADCHNADVADTNAAALATEFAAALGESPRAFQGDHEVRVYRDGLSIDFAVSPTGYARVEVRGMSRALALRLAAAIVQEDSR